MNFKRIRVGAAVFAFAFFVFALASPSLLAQEKSGKQVASARYVQLLQYIFNFVEENYVDEPDSEKLYEGALKGMLDSLGDPYTAYIDSESLLGTSLKDTTLGEFGGVGLSITKPLESTPEKPAWVEVASPIEDSPGWKAGVQPGDLIISIDGTATADITMEKVLSILRGPIGTDVTIVVRRGKAMEFPVTLNRARIEVPTVKNAIMDNGIGYLRIVEFTPLTAERVQDALDSFRKDGYKGLIIDLRNNPGGLITSVVDVADKFIDEGVIVSTRSRIPSENHEYKASRLKTTFDGKIPIVVLVNKGSASAAEILAGALKDYRLAYIVGETSYGKGSVQQIIDLLNEDAMKITMARYYTPSDANIDKLGIPPDREVLFPVLTEAEEKALSSLLATTKIADWVAANGEAAFAKAESYAAELAKEYPVGIRLLKRLVTQEYYRTRLSPLYDLEYDIQLKAAVDVLRKEDVFALVKTTKTVRELQDEVKAAAEKAAAAAGVASASSADAAPAAAKSPRTAPAEKNAVDPADFVPQP